MNFQFQRATLERKRTQNCRWQRYITPSFFPDYRRRWSRSFHVKRPLSLKYIHPLKISHTSLFRIEFPCFVFDFPTFTVQLDAACFILRMDDSDVIGFLFSMCHWKRKTAKKKKQFWLRRANSFTWLAFVGRSGRKTGRKMAVAASEIRADVLQNGVARILLEAVMKLASLTGSPPIRFRLPLELFD